MKKIIFACLLITLAFTVFTSKIMAQKKSPLFNHVALYVVDLKKSTAFYRDIIQIDTMPEPFHDGKHTWFAIGPHSQFHLIEGAKEIIPRERHNHLCFSVPSVEEMIKVLNKANIPYSNLKGETKAFTLRVDGVKQIYLQDPDNYWIEINDDKY